MRKWLILLSALCGTTASAAPAWTWVDANGTVHFSDTPVPGARQIELTGAQAFGPRTQSPSGARTAPRASGQADTGTSIYRNVDVVSPTEQETLHNIGAMLNVVVRSEPPLQPGHRYDVLFDGQRRNLNTSSPRFALPDVFRGTHTLQAVVIDAAGAEIGRSPTRTFHVQQTSVLNRN
jgi:hypothetical protein